MWGRRTPSPRANSFWPISNVTAEQEAERCSGAPNEASSLFSRDTDSELRSLTYVGSTNYAKYRLKEASQSKIFGKHKKVRPPPLSLRYEIGGDSAPTTRNGSVSGTSSRQSLDYREVEEAAAARIAMLEAEVEAKRALARLADTQRRVWQASTKQLLKGGGIRCE